MDQELKVEAMLADVREIIDGYAADNDEQQILEIYNTVTGNNYTTIDEVGTSAL